MGMVRGFGCVVRLGIMALWAILRLVAGLSGGGWGGGLVAWEIGAGWGDCSFTLSIHTHSIWWQPTI